METNLLKVIDMNKFARIVPVRRAATLAGLAAGSLVALPSHAAAVDVAAVVTDIGAQIAPITAIGGAVLLVVVSIKAFKWVRRALS
ncbi:major capsid protein [uncultured Pseudacidovorax sp.]|uniref:major capsid protein n=1 Tax=uncultured Pseudacidovorax sp. TaxID=679313 RepID=UPI0025D9DD41|nr:major capsid protein [uncultured Pseudacidovorax sp.]